MSANVHASKGRRYTFEERGKILSFMRDFNAENGRGGLLAASRKFNVRPFTISNWTRYGSRARIERLPHATTWTGPVRMKLEEMLLLLDQIDDIEAKLRVMRTRLDVLKASL